MFCNIFHQWTDWIQYSASVPGHKGSDVEINDRGWVETLQFRDCRHCGKRQLQKIKIR